jgi:hypothetical protein
VINKKYYLLIIKMSNSRFSELDSLGLRLANTTASNDFLAKQGDAVVANLGSLFSDTDAQRGVGMGLLQRNEESGIDLSRNNLSINFSIAPRNDGGGNQSADAAVIKLNTQGGAVHNTYDSNADMNEGIYLSTIGASQNLTSSNLTTSVDSDISVDAGNDYTVNASNNISAIAGVRNFMAGSDGLVDGNGAALDLSGAAKLSADDTIELNAQDGVAKLTLDENAVLQSSGEVTIKHNDGNDYIDVRDGEVIVASDAKVAAMIDANNKLEITSSSVLLDHATKVEISTDSNVQVGTTVTTTGLDDNNRMRINSASLALIHNSKVYVDTDTLDVDASVDISGANFDAYLTGSNKQHADGTTKIGNTDGKEMVVDTNSIKLDHSSKVHVETATLDVDASVDIFGANFDADLTGSNKQHADGTTKIGNTDGKEMVVDTNSIKLDHTIKVHVETATLDVDAATVDMDTTNVQIDADDSVLVNASNQLKIAESGETNFLDLSAGDAALVTGTGELNGITQMTVIGATSSLDLSANAKLESDATIELEATNDLSASADNFLGTYQTLNKQYTDGTTKIGNTDGKEMVVDTNSIKLDHATKVEISTDSNVQVGTTVTTTGLDDNNRMRINSASLALIHNSKVYVDTDTLDVDASVDIDGANFDAYLTGSNKQHADGTTKIGNTDGKEIVVDTNAIKLDHATKVHVETATLDVDAATVDIDADDSVLVNASNQLKFAESGETNFLDLSAGNAALVTRNGEIIANNFEIITNSNLTMTSSNAALLEAYGTDSEENQKIDLSNNMVLSGSSNISLRAANQLTLVRDEDDDNAAVGKIQIKEDSGEEHIVMSGDKTFEYVGEASIKASPGSVDTFKVDTTSGSEKVTVGYDALTDTTQETLLVNGSAKITGKLEVAGDLEYRSVIKTQLDLSDNIIRLNYGGGEVNDAGFIFADISSETPKHAAFVYDAAPGADAFVCQYVPTTLDEGGSSFVTHDPESAFNNEDVTNLADFRAKTILCQRVKAASDARLKKNVEEFANAMEQVKKLRPVWYNWKKDEDSVGKEMGFIAQEIEEEIPSLVHTERTGYKSVEYAKMVALLTKALQEQQEQIDALRAEVAELKKD